MAEAKTINTRLVLRNADLSAWEKSSVELLAGEMALANLSGELSNNYGVRIGVGGKTWSQLSNEGQLIIPVENVYGLKTLSGDLDQKIETEITNRKDADIALSNSLSSGLSVALTTSAGTGDVLSVYTLTQGGNTVGSIEIPKDYVISTAYLVNVSAEYSGEPVELTSFNVKYADENFKVEKNNATTSAEYWSIYNVYSSTEVGGDGFYLRLTTTNEKVTPIYIAMPELVDSYIGGTTDTISVHINANTRTIYATVVDKSIGSAQLTEELSTIINNLELSAKYNRAAADVLSADENTMYSAKWAATSAYLSAKAYTDTAVENCLTAAKAYTNDVSSTLSTTFDNKINALDLAKVDVGAAKTLKFIEQTDGQVSAEAVDILIQQSQVSNLTADLDAISANLTGDADGSVNARIKTASEAAKTYTDGVSAWLSGDYFKQISGEATRAKAAEEAIDDRVTSLSTEVGEISADHEGRISANERAIELLSSATHFRGVLLSSEIPEEAKTSPLSVEMGLVNKFKPCAKGDIAIYEAGTEFIYGSDLSAETSGWIKLGDEGTYVTKAQHAADVAALQAVDEGLRTDVNTVSTDFESFKTIYSSERDYISAEVSAKVKVGEGHYDGTTWTDTLAPKTSLSVVKIADEDYYKLVAEGKQDNDVVYIVSSDNVNGHNQRVINVGTAISDTDAVNLSGMNAAIEEVKKEIVANALSGVTINDISGVVENNVAVFNFTCISCGGAE